LLGMVPCGARSICMAKRGPLGTLHIIRGVFHIFGGMFPFLEETLGVRTHYLIHFHIFGGIFHLLRYLGQGHIVRGLFYIFGGKLFA
jgi:hypothetical protein